MTVITKICYILVVNNYYIRNLYINKKVDHDVCISVHRRSNGKTIVSKNIKFCILVQITFSCEPPLLVIYN